MLICICPHAFLYLSSCFIVTVLMLYCNCPHAFLYLSSCLSTQTEQEPMMDQPVMEYDSENEQWVEVDTAVETEHPKQTPRQKKSQKRKKQSAPVRKKKKSRK